MPQGSATPQPYQQIPRQEPYSPAWQAPPPPQNGPQQAQPSQGYHPPQQYPPQYSGQQQYAAPQPPQPFQPYPQAQQPTQPAPFQPFPQAQQAQQAPRPQQPPQESIPAPRPGHPVWPKEGDPGVEAFRPPKQVAIRLYMGWIPILIPQFAVWTLLTALVPQFVGVHPPVPVDFGVGALSVVASAIFLWTKFKKGAMSTVLLVSPVGIETVDNLGFLNRLAWPDMVKVGRVVAIAQGKTIKGGGDKTFAQKELKDMGVIGWGVRKVPAIKLPEQMRQSLAKLPYDPVTAKHYISIPLSVIEKDWVDGRIAQLIQQYRPDLSWDMHDEMNALKSFGGS